MVLEEEYVKNVYEEIANEFNDTRHYKWPFITTFITQQPRQSLIYDIGCGNGRNMEYSNYNFIGIDNCRNFCDICHSKGLEVYQNDMINIPFKDNSADALMCIAAFHHLSNIKRRIRSLQEMKRVIIPNGRIIISVWSKTQPKQTKREFKNYGDNFVKWKRRDDKEFERFYYIFIIDEIMKLFKYVGLECVSHTWEFGNDIFILQKN
jgi:ubiquinone/menaquinone biosynthesis C-methylase UbiE